MTPTRTPIRRVTPLKSSTTSCSGARSGKCTLPVAFGMVYRPGATASCLWGCPEIVTSQCQVTTRFRHRLFVHQQVNISGTHGVRDDPLLK